MHAETLEQTCTRLSHQSTIEKNQAQYLNEISLLLREQSHDLRQRSRELRSRVNGLISTLEDWRQQSRPSALDQKS